MKRRLAGSSTILHSTNWRSHQNTDMHQIWSLLLKLDEPTYQEWQKSPFNFILEVQLEKCNLISVFGSMYWIPLRQQSRFMIRQDHFVSHGWYHLSQWFAFRMVHGLSHRVETPWLGLHLTLRSEPGKGESAGQRTNLELGTGQLI